MYTYYVTWIDRSRNVKDFRSESVESKNYLSASNFTAFQKLIVARHGVNVIGERPTIVAVSTYEGSIEVHEGISHLPLGCNVICLVGEVLYSGVLKRHLSDIYANQVGEVEIDCGFKETRIFPETTVLRTITKIKGSATNALLQVTVSNVTH